MNDTKHKLTLADLVANAFDAAWEMSGEGYNAEYLHKSAEKRFQAERDRTIAELLQWWEASQ